jgi:hypothetical protein
MYENSGNSELIRAEWAGKPYHPDQALREIKDLFLGLVNKLEVHAHPDDQKYADSTVDVCKAVLRKKVEEL